jgi:hypothetical protein
LTGRQRAHDPSGLPAGFWRYAAVTALMRAGMFISFFLAYYLARQLRLDAVQVAVAVAAWGAGWALGDPVAGWLANCAGARAVIVSGGLLAAAAYLTAPLARTFGGVVVIAAVIGFVQDTWRPAVTGGVAAAATGKAQRERALSVLAWIMQAAAITAAVAGGLISARFGLVWLFPANAAAAALAAVVAATMPVTQMRPRRDREAVAGDPVALILLGAFTVLTVVALAAEQLESVTLPVRYASLGIAPTATGLIMAVNPASCAVIQPLIQRWLTSLPAAVVCAAGMALLGVGMAVTGSGHTTAWFMATSLIWVTGEVLLITGGQFLVTAIAPPDKFHGYLGTWQASFGSSVFVAGVAGAALIHAGGLHLLWMSCAAAGLGSAALCACLASPIALRARRVARRAYLTRLALEPPLAFAGAGTTSHGREES